MIEKMGPSPEEMGIKNEEEKTEEENMVDKTLCYFDEKEQEFFEMFDKETDKEKKEGWVGVIDRYSKAKAEIINGNFKQPLETVESQIYDISSEISVFETSFEERKNILKNYPPEAKQEMDRLRSITEFLSRKQRERERGKLEMTVDDIKRYFVESSIYPQGRADYGDEQKKCQHELMSKMHKAVFEKEMELPLIEIESYIESLDRGITPEELKDYPEITERNIKERDKLRQMRDILIREMKETKN